MLSLTSKAKKLVCPLINPDAYTASMAALQAPPAQAPLATTFCFEVPQFFEDTIYRNIASSKSLEKVPGPGRIRMETILINRQLFCKSFHSIWQSSGRLAWISTSLRPAQFSPINKGEGEPSLPSKNIPICLISEIRKVMSSVFLGEVIKHYTRNLLQWGKG